MGLEDEHQHAPSGQGIVVMGKKLVPKPGKAHRLDQGSNYPWLAMFYRNRQRIKGWGVGVGVGWKD